MPSTTTKYIVYNHSGSGIRHHHFTVSNDIIAEADGTAASGDHLTAQGFPFQFWNSDLVPFAFMSVSGGTNGPQLYTSPGNRDVPVGSDAIIITVVYAPPGGVGGPGGVPGVWIDAFNVDAGGFSDQPHIMTVLTNGVTDVAKTNFANSEGVIATDTSAELMRADDIVDGLPFLEWKQILGTPSVINSKDDLLAQNETNEIWIAFYQSQSSNVAIPHVNDKLYQALATWINDDYCGTPYPHHIGPGPLPFGINIERKILNKLNDAQKKKLEGYKKEYKEVANAGYASMQKVTAILAGVSKIISQVKGK